MAVGRPLAEPIYLERPRLLSALPREPGNAAVLEAPFGYGKTVLLAQWAEGLAGFRRIWIDLLPGDDPRARLFEALGLAREAPWRALIRELKKRPTLIVIDDLGALEPVAPLFKELPALVGVASRGRLAHPELARLAAAGRLVRLGAEDLAFTKEEAIRLVGDRARGEALWQKTGGWPIALHLAAVSRGEPDWASLVAGLRESLAPALFSELLFLAATRTLPREAARPETERLAQLGLLHRAEGGYRIHAALAEALPEPEVQAALLKDQDRLSPALLGRALERLGLWPELAALLERPPGPGLAAVDPAAVLRWDARAPGPRGPNRRMRVAVALLHLGRLDEGAAAARAIAREETTPPAIALEALGLAAYFLAEGGRGEEARSLLHEAEPFEAAVEDDPEFLARYLNDKASVLYKLGEKAAAKDALARALDRIPRESPFFPLLRANLATLRFELEGRLLGHRRVLEEVVRAWEAGEVPEQFTDPEVELELARDLWLLGEVEAALRRLRRAEAGGEKKRTAGVRARIERAAIQGDEAALLEALAEAEALAQPALADRARAELARLALARGEREAARRWLCPAEGFWSRLVRAELEADPGRLPRPKTREEALFVLAARVRLGDAAALDELLALTDAGERVLPALVPLDRLPLNRPELARAYPLAVVLKSGWKDAILARKEEIPPLRVRVLGAFDVAGPLGEVRLSGRLAEVFALLLLGLDRDAILEAVWPGLDRERARNNLYVQQNHLRRLLEPWGVPTYLTEAGLTRVEADLFDLEKALEKGDARAALSLYREPVFAGVDNPQVDAYRETLKARLLAVLRAALKQHPDDEALLEGLFWLEPWDPAAAAPWIRRLVESGRRERALSAYRRFAEAYAATLDEPPPPFEALLRPV